MENKRVRKFQVLLIGDSAEFEYNNIVAYEIGAFIAKKNWVLITGGRSGVMRSACKGAIDNNGLTVSIIPDSNIESSNEYSSIVIATGIGFARNYTNALSCDIAVVVGGGAGTLSEITYLWLADKPIIACSFVPGVSKEYAGKNIDYRKNSPIIDAKNIDEVFYNMELIAQKLI
ncbi:MAG TPA: TIGR00725 family protein [Spirochaetota bacterium]|nr:TIGR00725 family protein [Spirochaetota bacterium]HOM37635.1 TIGR00725 family protein [Spirochaetota bacterium]HPQ49394.1 TIGR00725 family protein [Spirochaetota bacterium]